MLNDHLPHLHLQFLSGREILSPIQREPYISRMGQGGKGRGWPDPEPQRGLGSVPHRLWGRDVGALLIEFALPVTSR